jgi:hypothetical protein
VKFLAAFVLFLTAAVSPDVRYFRYQRPLQGIPQQSTQACFVLDPGLFAHSAAGLADLRLYRNRNETLYLIQTSGPAPATAEGSIAPLNLGSRAGEIVFDAAMPSGTFNDLQLKVSAHDFIATVRVSGSQQQAGPVTKIGSYTIFDLTHQRLGRSTILHLPASDFRYLHFAVSGPLRSDDIDGLTIPQASTIHASYVAVAETSQATRKDRSTIIEFTIPAHIPVDRVTFKVPAQPANFSRDVTISAAEISPKPIDESAPPPQSFTSSGNLLRVHILEENRRIDQESLEVDTLHAAFNEPSRWTISIDNGDNAPLMPSSVRLEMFERDLCFQSSPDDYTLYYGDPALNAPRYDIGQFLVISSSSAARVTTAPEQRNPEYQPRPDQRPFTERHPALLWTALAIVIALLGLIALRSARAQPLPNKE